MKLHLNITEELIKKAIPKDGAFCPIALALKECKLEFVDIQIPDIDVESGNSITFRTDNGYGWKLCNSRPDLDKFILSFDKGEEVKPFETDVEFCDFNEDDPDDDYCGEY
jgi:hypothetical protein